jgi:hypothetical protein
MSEITASTDSVNVVELGGETIRLTAPKGRGGRMFIIRVQTAFKALMEDGGGQAFLEGALPGSKKKKDEDEVKMFMSMISTSTKLWTDPEVMFEDEVLPGFFIWSTHGLDKAGAIEKLEQISDTPLQILVQFFSAATFWMSPQEAEDAFREAVGKSEEETEEVKSA